MKPGTDIPCDVELILFLDQKRTTYRAAVVVCLGRKGRRLCYQEPVARAALGADKAPRITIALADIMSWEENSDDAR